MHSGTDVSIALRLPDKEHSEQIREEFLRLNKLVLIRLVEYGWIILSVNRRLDARYLVVGFNL